MSSQLQELYAKQIRTLPVASRLQLISLIARDLAAEAPDGRRQITDLRGLGKEIWQGVNAQEHVDQLRQEWNRD
jgi:hypothetical protein